MADDPKVPPNPAEIARLAQGGPPWAQGWAIVLSSIVAAVLALGIREIAVTWLDRSAETAGKIVEAEQARDTSAVQGLIKMTGDLMGQQSAMTTTLRRLVDQHEARLEDHENRLRRIERAHPKLADGGSH